MPRRLPFLELPSELGAIPEFLCSRVKTCHNGFFIDLLRLIPPPPLVQTKNISIIIYFVIFFPGFLLRSVVARGETPHGSDARKTYRRVWFFISIWQRVSLAELRCHHRPMVNVPVRDWNSVAKTTSKWFLMSAHAMTVNKALLRDEFLRKSHWVIRVFCFRGEACARSQWFRVFANFQQHHPQTARISIKSVKRGGKMFHLKERKISIQFFSLRCSTLKSLISFVCGIAFCSGKDEEKSRSHYPSSSERSLPPLQKQLNFLVQFRFFFSCCLSLLESFSPVSSQQKQISQARSFCCGWMPTFLSFCSLPRKKFYFYRKESFLLVCMANPMKKWRRTTEIWFCLIVFADVVAFGMKIGFYVWRKLRKVFFCDFQFFQFFFSFFARIREFEMKKF